MSFSLEQNQINKIIEIALQAGEISKDFFNKRNFEISIKKDGSKVTSADIEVSNYIFNNLSKLFPEIAIICEERIQNSQYLQNNIQKIEKNKLFWLIDPIDGTSSFVNNCQNFCLTMSLIFNEKPIFGLIYAPIFEGGKLFYNNQKKVFLRKNNQETLIEESLNNKNFSFKNKVKIITSKRSTDEEIRNFFCNNSSLDFNKIEIQKLSSAVKFFKILEGESDIYIHFKPTMEWDVAAGNFLVELIGRKVKNIKFNESGKISLGNFCYHKRDFKNKPFIISQNWNFLN